MELYNMKSALPLVSEMWGVDVSENSFEDLAMIAWELINNKHTKLYNYSSGTNNRELQLPCNADVIEAVTIPQLDAQTKTNLSGRFNGDAVFVENYIESWKDNLNPYYTRGKLIDYKEVGNTLCFSKDYPIINVLYHGVVMDDEEGLPMINNKEQKAISAYVAYITLFKEGVRKRDGNTINLANTVKAEWLRLCNAARQSEHLSQNDMNAIANVKHSYNRKAYGKSIKPTH